MDKSGEYWDVSEMKHYCRHCEEAFARRSNLVQNCLLQILYEIASLWRLVSIRAHLHLPLRGEAQAQVSPYSTDGPTPRNDRKVYG